MNFKLFLERFDADAADFGMSDHPNAKHELNLKKLLEQKSGEFLDESKGQLMIRGIKSVASRADKFLGYVVTEDGDKFPAYVLQTRKDRRPDSTNEKFHHFLDGWFEKNTGIKARSNSTFAVGAKALGAASGYGTVCAIFPVGDYQYVWSPKNGDLWSDFWAHASAILSKEEQQTLIPLIRGDDGDYPHAQEIADKVLKDMKFTTWDLADGLRSGNEIMLAADEYIAIPLSKKDRVGSMRSIASSTK